MKNIYKLFCFSWETDGRRLLTVATLLLVLETAAGDWNMPDGPSDLFLENADFRFYELGEAIFVKSTNLIFLLNAAAIDEFQLFRNRTAFKNAFLTPSGLVTKTTQKKGNIFGSFYHDVTDNIFIPLCQAREDDIMAAKKSFFENQLIRYLQKLKIGILIDDYTEAEDLECYKYFLKNVFHQTKKASVTLISLGYKRNEAIIEFVRKLNNDTLNETTIRETNATLATILDALKITEFFPIAQKDELPIGKENLIPETLDLWRRATEVKLINKLEEIKRNIENDLRNDYGKLSYKTHELHSIRDISVYFPALKPYTIEEVADYYQRLIKILEVSNNFINLRKLMIFFKYIKRMNLENNHVRLSRIRLEAAITEVDQFVLRIIQWNAFRNSIFAALANDNVNVLNLVDTSRNGEDLREKLCASLKICWKTRLIKFEKSDLESIKNHVKINAECEGDKLRIVGSTISFKTLSRILKSCDCNYNIVEVVAFKEINVDGEIIGPDKKKLIILSPKWSINIRIINENVTDFYEGVCDAWLADPNEKINKTPCFSLKSHPEGVCWSDKGHFTSCMDLLKDVNRPHWPQRPYRKIHPFVSENERTARALSNSLSLILSAARSANKQEVIPILEYGRKNLEDCVAGKKKLTMDVKISLNYIHAFFLEYIKPVKVEPKAIRNLQSFGEKLRDYIHDLWEKEKIYPGAMMMIKTLKEVENEFKEVITMFKELIPQINSALDNIPKLIAVTIRKIPKDQVNGTDQSIVDEISSLLAKYMMFEVPKRHEFLGESLGLPHEKIAELIPRAAYSATKIVVNRIKSLTGIYSNKFTKSDQKHFEFINKATTALRLGVLKKYYNKYNATFHYLQVVHRLKCESPFETSTEGCIHLSNIIQEVTELNKLCSGIKDWGPEKYFLESYSKRFHVQEPQLNIDCQEKFLFTFRHMEWKAQIIESLPDETDLGQLMRFRGYLERIYLFLQEESVPFLIPLAKSFKTRNEAVTYWVSETWYSWRKFLQIYEKEVKNLHYGTRAVGFPKMLKAFARYVNSPLGDYGRGLLLLPTFKGKAKEYEDLTKKFQIFLSRYAKSLISAKDAFRNEIFNQYLENINTNKQLEESLPPQTGKMVKKLDKILRERIMQNKAEEARMALRQYLFPFPDNVKNYWTTEILKVLEMITNTTFSEDFATTQKVKKQRFDPEICKCPPFFFWPFRKYLPNESIRNSFLAGKSAINLHANILLQKDIYEALKGRNFNIRLVPYGNRESLYWKQDMAEISKSLIGTSAEITHEGKAYTVYENKLYRTLTEPIKIILGSYTDGKFDNSINEIVGGNPLPLSPYSKWTIRLKHINSEQSDKLLDISHLIAGMELIGDGAFIQSNGNNHKTEENYKPVIEYEIYDENDIDFLVNT